MFFNTFRTAQPTSCFGFLKSEAYFARILFRNEQPKPFADLVGALCVKNARYLVCEDAITLDIVNLYDVFALNTLFLHQQSLLMSNQDRTFHYDFLGDKYKFSADANSTKLTKTQPLITKYLFLLNKSSIQKNPLYSYYFSEYTSPESTTALAEKQSRYVSCIFLLISLFFTPQVASTKRHKLSTKPSILKLFFSTGDFMLNKVASKL